MKLWLLVPVKPFETAKSRLSTVLSPAARSELARNMLVQTLRLGNASNLFSTIVVVSRSDEVLALAQREHAHALCEEENGLNPAILQGIRCAERAGADGVLVLPADLPLVTLADLQEIAGLIEEVDVVVAASADGGTNALCQRLPPCIAPAFGVDSFARHSAAAEAAHCRLAIVTSPTVAFDLDSPENWRKFSDPSGDQGVVDGFSQLAHVEGLLDPEPNPFCL
ncbi:MAG: 2-phospho-L-lactate guanylyltransferase [Anaerolineales bacterium]|nr:2-phospho-L-lactate guanylyltransferase [Anaerolineales bacterium]